MSATGHRSSSPGGSGAGMLALNHSTQAIAPAALHAFLALETHVASNLILKISGCRASAQRRIERIPFARSSLHLLPSLTLTRPLSSNFYISTDLFKKMIASHGICRACKIQRRLKWRSCR
jgi:hypothetical protein